MKKAFKYIYNLVPFKVQLFTVIRNVFHPEEKTYKHLHFKGIFKVPVKGNISFRMRHYGYQVENDIFWKGLTGRWEKKSIELWMKFTEKAQVVIDIGANTGIYALISKSLNSATRVIAFEPVERVFQKLEQNMQLNNFTVEGMQMAVSDHSGEAVFYDTIEEHTYTATLQKVSHDLLNTVKVKIITLDDLIKVKALDRIDLMKIDVEFHEPEVIKGFSLISRYHPSILIEILSDDIGRRVQKEIEDFGGGYLYFDIDEQKGLRNVENIRKSSGMNYLLCTEPVAREMGLL